MSLLNSFLSNTRILDLSQYIPGPLATLLLSDMGAEVIKIEPPAGDAMEHLGPRDAEGRPVFYRSLNGGKTVCRLNLKDPAGKARFLELVKQADVVVEGFRAGVMQRLGIDYPVLAEVNPGVILCSISGYGADGALAATAGHDANYLALMGMLDRNGTDKPAFFDPPVSDVAGALFAALSISGALLGRQRTGRGCAIDLALADTLMPLQVMQVAAFGANAKVFPRESYYLNGGAAYYQTYRTADDRHVVVGAVEPKFWWAFCLAADRQDWIARQGDPMPQTGLKAELAEYFATMTADAANALFSQADCCFSVVRDLGEALRSEQVLDRRLVQVSASGELQSLFPARVNGEPPASRTEMRGETQGCPIQSS
ncbi:CaiB/BaiF CoA transferase family protein [Mesorhizobium sp. ANAO-SY3R2]|uniref:CaiB/BaiF CoA transferase family protein n=1 Tax=Mesorhizobium sp. ANAO-SY3R2 TaxID=3166644 RepID=UPI0036722BC5